MDKYIHKTVLLDEAIDILNIKPDGIYVDCTLGGGGHSSKILEKLDTGHLYCFDQDEYAIKKADDLLKKISNNYTIIKANFKDIKEELSKRDISKVDGILYDLGVSSFQFDIPERGFSYNYDALLDMRMDKSQELSAYTIVNEWSFQDIMRILMKYADERFAKHIARKIEKYREIKAITTTLELVEIIKDAIPAPARRTGGHPAKRTFQALRIAVNDELNVFEKSLDQALELIKVEGIICVISFHSLEDKITKHTFKEKTEVELPRGMFFIPPEMQPSFELVNKKPILPTAEELVENNRAHSAKLRAIKRIKE